MMTLTSLGMQSMKQSSKDDRALLNTYLNEIGDKLPWFKQSAKIPRINRRMTQLLHFFSSLSCLT